MSFNYNSPILNNMGIGYNNPIPPNPIGNIVNVGNSGYLSGNYNGRFLSPSQRRQMEEARIAQERELERQQCDMFKKISRNVNKGLGIEVTEEQLSNRYSPIYEQQRQLDADEQSFYHLYDIDSRCLDFNPYAARMVANCNAYHDHMEQQFPKDMTLTEFYEESYKLKLEEVLNEQKQKQRNLTSLYDRDGYNKIREMHKKISNQYNSALSNESDNIDDMTVTRFNLPERLRQSREERIARFRAQCLNQTR